MRTVYPPLPFYNCPTRIYQVACSVNSLKFFDGALAMSHPNSLSISYLLGSPSVCVTESAAMKLAAQSVQLGDLHIQWEITSSTPLSCLRRRLVPHRDRLNRYLPSVQESTPGGSLVSLGRRYCHAGAWRV